MSDLAGFFLASFFRSMFLLMLAPLDQAWREETAVVLPGAPVDRASLPVLAAS
jgi:hypothetical protein